MYNNITATTTEEGRVYHTPEGDFPSITTILGKTANNIWLQQWKERVGEEEARKVSKYATDRGELVHEYAERHIKGEDIYTDLNKDYSYIDLKNMTINLINTIKENVTKVYAQEIAVYSPTLKYAGRLDCYGDWKGIPALIDFKTSKKNKYIRDIKDYYIQTSAYAYAHNELFKTNIQKLVILITVENKQVQVFEGNMIHHLPDLKYRLNTYYKARHNK